MSAYPKPDPDELKQRYDFSRHVFQVFVGWFTVFCTLNIGVLGWIATSTFGAKDAPLGQSVAVMLSAMMVVQNILGIWACVSVRSALRRNNDRASVLVAAESVAQPMRFYACATHLCQAACVTYILAWVLVPTLVPWRETRVAAASLESTVPEMRTGRETARADTRQRTPATMRPR